MSLKLGTADVSKVYLGSTAAQKVYLGTTQVWSAFGITGFQLANAETVAIPDHAAGDVIVLFVRGNSAVFTPTAGGTVPTWIALDSGAGSGAYRTMYCVASAAGRTSGTWTSASGIIAVVLRGAASSPIGGHAGLGPSASPTNRCTAPAVTMSKTDGTSIHLNFFGWGDGTFDISAIAAAPTGYTRRASGIYASNKVGICLNTKDVTTTAPAVVQPSTSNGWYSGATVEILAG
jgi:hypothetical protein